jgi:hypothetical protein
MCLYYLLELGKHMQSNLFTLFFQSFFRFRVRRHVNDILGIDVSLDKLSVERANLFNRNEGP